MNKIFLGFLFLLNAMVYSVELWNGFTTEMSENDIINRANEILNLQASSMVFTNGSDLPSISNYDMPSSNNLRILAMWSGLDGLMLTGVGPQYRYYNAESKFAPNVLFIFYNDKLLCINIYWQSVERDLINLSRQRYGAPTSVLKYRTGYTPFSSPGDDMLMWRLQGRDYFVYGHYMLYVNQQLRNIYISEKARIEREAREAEEARRRAANESIRF
jgi:hypothetical protein